MCSTAILPAVISADNATDELVQVSFILNRWVKLLSDFGTIKPNRLSSDCNIIHRLLCKSNVSWTIKHEVGRCRDMVISKVSNLLQTISSIKSTLLKIKDVLEGSYIKAIQKESADQGMSVKYRHFIDRLKKEKFRKKGNRLIKEIDVDVENAQSAHILRRIVEKRAAQTVARQRKSRLRHSNAFRHDVRRVKSFSLYYAYEPEYASMKRERSSHWTFKVDKSTGEIMKKKKHSYSSREEAEAACRIWESQHPEDKVPMVSYLCPHCGNWHIGHNRHEVDYWEAEAV